MKWAIAAAILALVAAPALAAQPSGWRAGFRESPVTLGDDVRYTIEQDSVTVRHEVVNRSNLPVVVTGTFKVIVGSEHISGQIGPFPLQLEPYSTATITGTVALDAPLEHWLPALSLEAMPMWTVSAHRVTP